LTTTHRRTIFAGLLVLCAVVAALAIGKGIETGDDSSRSSAGARDVLPSARDADRRVVAFLQRGRRRTGGQVALATLGPAPGRAQLGPMSCDRMYFAAGEGICLARGSAFAAGYRAKIFGADLRVRHEVPVEGVPSRARVSPDGRYGSVTMFVTGHSYADAGAFSTKTTLIDLRGGRSLGDLEEFTVTRAGRQVTAVDVNFWGVTFARDSDRFYATMATGGKTYLLEGSVGARTAHVIHENVECPSLSPDGTRIAYKRRNASGTAPWRLTVLDLATKRETPLAETRSVDDQVEWLDDRAVLYGLGGQVRQVPADGSGSPRTFLAGADSPAIVRW
jgi:hypothetical protein